MTKSIFFKNKILGLFLLTIVAMWSCKRGGIDPISEVAPGPDTGAPVIDIQFPAEGSKIKVLEAITSINIKFEATDDIELQEVKVDFNGDEIASISDFKDYRRYLADFDFDEVPNGVHTISVTATDTEGKSTTEAVSFEKEAPYTARYAGEVLYMPFDNEFIDLVRITRPEVIGNPSFSEETIAGTGAYKGIENGYLQFATDDLQNEEFTAVFWMKVNATPDRAGILVMGPPDEANPDNANNRNAGFRFFRENAGGMQRFKLNVGTGAGNNWFDGGMMADVTPDTDEWNHFAFTISSTRAAVYINGQVASEGDFDGISWDGTDILSIMSGAPRFVGWNHRSDQSIMDELRVFDRALSQEEIQGIISDETGIVIGNYTPKYEGETFYLPFSGDYTEQVSGRNALVVGEPGFSDMGVVGNAYTGAEGAYLRFPTDGLLGEEFSAVFWMNINATPDRAGVLVIGPPDEANPDNQNNRSSGFRFFRENAGGMQRFKLNAGTGDGDSWFDGGTDADVEPNTGDWHHFAFTISPTENIVYIDGKIVRQGEFAGIDWTGTDVLSIMSGDPRFTGWNHLSDQSLMDELRLFNRAISQQEIINIIADESGEVVSGYAPKYDGETFYLPFNGDFVEQISGQAVAVVGEPGLADGGVEGTAYAGAEDAYLQVPTEGLVGGEFSASFWMNINATPDRAGILVVGPPDAENPDSPNKRTSGFRFFRENAGGMQRFKLNVGTGEGESWFDGGTDADVEPDTGDWHHFAFTISGTEAVVYIDGEIARQSEFSGIDWTDTDVLSIMSGAPRFMGWNHLSDQSLMDELRLFNKALSQEEVLEIMGDGA